MSGPLRVLVVDDEEGPRTFLEELVRGRGHVVVSAGSLAEATAALAEGPFDLVVMDLNLPVNPGRLPLAENGYELELRVRARFPGDRTYLIVLTGKGLEAMDSSLAHDHGCDAYVLKGDRARLLSKLAEGEARAHRNHRPARASKLPLKAKTWEDCAIVFDGDQVLAETTSGAREVIHPTAATLNALRQFGWAKPDEGSDLQGPGRSKGRRSTLARDVRSFYRETFRVEQETDPLPRQRARKTWISLVRVREREDELEVEARRERLRRDSFDPRTK